MQTLRDLLLFIDEPNRWRCLELWEDNEELFQKAKGSSHNHQAWEGGYLDHVTQVMNVALRMFSPLDSMYPLPFKIGDVMLVLFLHDLEKPWKGTTLLPTPCTKEDRKWFRWGRIRMYHIELSDEQKNALEYVEGEGDDYSSKRRAMNELAAYCHMCDVASARIWHDKPEGHP